MLLRALHAWMSLSIPMPSGCGIEPWPQAPIWNSLRNPNANVSSRVFGHSIIIQLHIYLGTLLIVVALEAWIQHSLSPEPEREEPI